MKRRIPWLETVVCLWAAAGSVAGIIQVAADNFSGIAWWCVPLGIFIWGDAVILGPFLLVSAIFLAWKNNKVLSGMFFSAYACVRSFFEVIYALNAQFSTTIRPWELSWRTTQLVQLVGVTETYVLYQLIFTCLFIVSLSVLVWHVRAKPL